MTDKTQEPSLADLARAQANRRAEAEARKKASDDEAKTLLRKRLEHWNTLVVSARDYVNKVNVDLGGTGSQVELSEHKSEANSFSFGSLKLALRREDGRSKTETVEFRCSTVGYIDYDIALPGKDKRTQQMYIDDMEDNELNQEIKKFLTEAFSA